MMRKGKLPRFHEVIKQKAIEIVDRTPVDTAGSTSSFEFSTSFFDFDDLGEESGEIAPKIMVHAIGKPKRLGMTEFGSTNGKTYHTLQWEVGKDIAAKDVEMHLDIDGCLYVWFRWGNDRWQWSCISKADFARLRQVEG